MAASSRTRLPSGAPGTFEESAGHRAMREHATSQASDMWQNRRMPRGPEPLDALIATVRSWISGARSLVALTGAGISTDSGIPDFRGPQGLWTKNPVAEKMSNIRHYLADTEVRKASWQNRLSSPAWTA